MKKNKRITDRINYNRILNGYCLICKQYGKLTKDHVPPKGSVTITKREQRTISESHPDNFDNVKGLPTFRASTFKTICRDCNSTLLSQFDSEICTVTKSITSKVKDYFILANQIYPYIEVPFDAKKFTRGMIGHILSASSIKACLNPISENHLFSPLRDYVSGKVTTFEDTHDIYYWFYPHATHISAQGLAFFNEGHICECLLLYFFPIAFLITLKGQGTFPAHALKLNLSDDKLRFNMSLNNIPFSSFPFIELKGNQMLLFNDEFTCISYPIKNE